MRLHPKNQEARDRQAADGPVALAEYKQARDKVLLRMIELRAERLRRQFKEKQDNGGQ
jgi:hypothetical protein